MGRERHNYFPRVTVIIVNWNGAQFLDQCLASVFAQSIEPYEVILVDNASTDDSLKIARQYPKVRLLAQAENLGFARANNLAIRLAVPDAEWIVLLNPDAFPETLWLEELLQSAKSHPEYDIFASTMLNAGNPTILDGAGDAYCITGRVMRAGHNSPISCFPLIEKEIFSACAAAAMYRRDALSCVAGFDEDFFCYLEDVDLGFRLRLAGYRTLFVPRSIVRHVGSGTTGSQHSDFASYYGHRNLVWVFVKNMPSILFWMLLPLHVLLNVASVFYLLLRGQGMVGLHSKIDALCGIPKMWSKRLQIQQMRKATSWAIWNVLNKSLF